MNLQRKNLMLFNDDDWHWADKLNQWLKRKGLDTKLVARYAVQVHPDQFEEARALLPMAVAALRHAPPPASVAVTTLEGKDEAECL